MKHSYHNLALTIALGITCSTSFCARGVLKADGILKVKGADLSAAHVTVVPQGAQAFILPVGTRTFMLELPLNDVYLVDFEREGCPSKQIYFDTRVPAEYHADMFTFPFMVTLEYLDPEQMFAYEGPVGFVRYQHELRDFGYDTQYLVKLEEELRDRLEQMRVNGTDPKIFLAPAAALVVNIPRGAVSTFLPPEQEGTQAPNLREMPRLVHVVERPSTDVAIAREMLVLLMVRTAATERIPARPTLRYVVLPALANASPYLTPSLAESTPIARPLTATLEKAPDNAALVLVAPSVSSVGARAREEQFIQEDRRLIYLVRFIDPNGTVEEIRKVAHAYGGVFYFDNSRSITEREFEELTSIP